MGIQISWQVTATNHSQFADDTLLLGGSSKVITQQFKKVLEISLNIFRGIINKTKSQIYVCNYSDHLTHTILAILEFHISTKWKYFKYLGMSISIGKDWSIIILKIKTNVRSTMVESIREDSINQVSKVFTPHLSI